jgi:hypothetical protein
MPASGHLRTGKRLKATLPKEILLRSEHGFPGVVGCSKHRRRHHRSRDQWSHYSLQVCIIATISRNSFPMPACHRLRGSRLRIAGFIYRLKAEGIRFKWIDREPDVGGVWRFRANEYSHLQARSRIPTPRITTMVL